MLRKQRNTIRFGTIRLKWKPAFRIGNAEGRLIVHYLQQHGAVWDIIINGINRNPEFEQLPHNVQAMYNNNAVRI